MKKLIVAVVLGLCGSAWSQPVEVVPAPGSSTQEERPYIQVSWPKGQLATENVHLYMNGKDVTYSALRSDDYVSFRPWASEAGPVDMKFVALDAQGRPLEKSWQFEVKPQAWVHDLSHTGAKDLFEGDWLRVAFQSTAKGKASFQVGDWAPVAMRESEPGYYVGEYRVKPTDSAIAKPLKVHYQLGDHKETVQAKEPVRIFGGLYRVRVETPLDGAQVEQNFHLAGHARPGSRVWVLPRLGFDTNSAATTTAGGAQLGAIPAEVDAEGNYFVDYGVPVLLPGMKVVFSIYSIDPDGNRSAATVVSYNFK
ncbi:MAG: hypothetical protein KF760_21600 [Candidatus Eremiobacteraeota bacterium]|nr:hypothetical protein [Candidatus Eremiobacteraeota bacterium]MCW5872704.1 hypothetical protein [Candidatus Eremiobacteraeota bacterium]